MDGHEDEAVGVLAGLSNLVDPVRRRLYRYLTASPEPVTRESAAVATGISRTLAAYHLDKLAESGLVEAGYARPEGRGGPGAGRPAKHYARADREFAVSVPARSYLMMAEVLAAAVDADAGGAVRDAAAAAARSAGRAAAEGLGLEAALRVCGYEPTGTGGEDIAMRNCPFHRLSRAHTDLVCGLNLELVRGLVEGAADTEGRGEAVLSPQEGRCCVLVRNREEPS